MPNVVLRISRPKINWSPMPLINVCQDHYNRCIICKYLIKKQSTVVVGVGACEPPTLNGCLENISIRRTRSSRPKKDTICLVPCLAVSSASQHTTNSSSKTQRTLDESEGITGREVKKSRKMKTICTSAICVTNNNREGKVL